MLRLLGLLSLGNLLFGGRHHRRMLRRGLFFGAILGYLAHKDFDMEQVEEDARKAARTVKRTVHEAARAAKREIRDARRAEQQGRDVVRETMRSTICPADDGGEVIEHLELAKHEVLDAKGKAKKGEQRKADGAVDQETGAER